MAARAPGSSMRRPDDGPNAAELKVFDALRRAADAGAECPTNHQLANAGGYMTGGSITHVLRRLTQFGLIAVKRYPRARRQVTIVTSGNTTAFPAEVATVPTPGVVPPGGSFNPRGPGFKSPTRQTLSRAEELRLIEEAVASGRVTRCPGPGEIDPQLAASRIQSAPDAANVLRELGRSVKRNGQWYWRVDGKDMRVVQLIAHARELLVQKLVATGGRQAAA